MNRPHRIVTTALIGLLSACLVLPVLAQNPGERENPKEPKTPPHRATSDVTRAREMAQLVMGGQLNLRDATALAEKHVKGTALDVSARIEAGTVEPAAETPHGPAADAQDNAPQQPPGGKPDQTGGERIIYEICCFAENKIQEVTIDGLSRKVVNVRESKTLDGSSGQP